MSNTSAPWGLRWLRNLNGSAPTAQQNNYNIAYNYGSNIFTGDLVILSSGYINVASAASHPVLGVFLGCEYFDTTLKKQMYMPAWLQPTLTSTIVVTAYVCDDPNAVFEIQAGNSTTTGVTQANVGSAAKIVASAGSTTTYQSGFLLDVGNIAAAGTGGGGANYPIQIVGLGQRVGNDNTSAYNTVEVKLNDQSLSSINA